MTSDVRRMRTLARSCWLITAISLLLTPVAVEAQEGTVVWEEPSNISNTPQYSNHPAIVADLEGNVHVFWSEYVNGDPNAPGALGSAGNSIFHTRWDGVAWTSPTDILFVPTDPFAEFIAVHVDDRNRVHAVWTGISRFYYSYADTGEASSGHAWREPVVVGDNSAHSFWESDVVVDAAHAVHVIYATRGGAAGVYHTASYDEGLSWTPTTRLSLPLDLLEIGYSRVKITVDSEQRLHAIWQTHQRDGFGQAVYYARSVDGGKNWSRPAQLAYRDPGDTFVEYPYLLSSGQSTLDLIYADGSNRGRLHRISEDAGETWSRPFSVLSGMEGINGYIVPLVDGAGDKHLIVNMRARSTQAVGIYYAYWAGDDWTQAVPVDVLSPAASSAHYTDAIIRLGNEIHVVYTDIGEAEIWHVSGEILSAPAVPPVAISTVGEDDPTVTPEPTTTETTAFQQTNPAFTDTAPQRSTVFPLLLGTGVAMLLTTGALIIRKMRYETHA